MISSPRRLTQGINIQYADIQLEIKFLDLPRDIPAPAGGRPAPLAVGRATRGRREEGVSIKYALQSQYHCDRWVHPYQPNL